MVPKREDIQRLLKLLQMGIEVDLKKCVQLLPEIGKAMQKKKNISI